MKRATVWTLVAISMIAGATTACGVILGIPSDTNADPNFGRTGEGGPQPDTSTFPDGFVPDGGTPADTSFNDVVVLPDGGCNCFGGTCNGGVCQPVQVAKVTDPYLIDTDNTSLFVTDNITTILSFKIGSFDAGATVITSTEHAINDLKAGAGVVYFTNYNAGPNNNGVARCPNSVGCPSRIDYAPHNSQDLGVAFDSKNVYFTIDEAASGNGGVWSCLLGGCLNGVGAKRIAARDNPKRVATNGTTVAWIEGYSGSGVAYCATNGGAVSSASQLGLVDLDFGTAGNDLYALGNSSIFHQSNSSSATWATMSVANNLSQWLPLFHVDAAAKNVYWLNTGMGGSIYRCPVGADCLGNKPVLVVNQLMLPQSFTISNDSIYYTLVDGTIWRLKKQ